MSKIYYCGSRSIFCESKNELNKCSKLDQKDFKAKKCREFEAILPTDGTRALKCEACAKIIN